MKGKRSLTKLDRELLRGLVNRELRHFRRANKETKGDNQAVVYGISRWTQVRDTLNSEIKQLK